MCPTCQTAYIMRRGLSLSKGWVWVWQQDCNHKRGPVLGNAHGQIPDEGGG